LIQVPWWETVLFLMAVAVALWGFASIVGLRTRTTGGRVISRQAVHSPGGRSAEGREAGHMSHNVLTGHASTPRSAPFMIWVHGPRYMQVMYPDHEKP
jgi:hypothetical protein